ncbi:MarR family winged helix-turn-helix transcriptional regulator [Curtobacterium ammoniigenes]|uniref:MarR family winged helix-turn-helix transcriptional regulator n=1 Tax=Curtobacterium ammoniigenes TaxID=395387 RepID=UPI00082DAD1B|nr:MarR family transcriptional regulator [Curtobacterium ammoniigenes]
MEEIDPLALDRQLCFALAATSRSVVALYRDELEPLGLTHPQYLVMLALWEASPRTARSIAADLRLEPATITPLLRRLEDTGYIRRERDSTDERALAVTLTTAGNALRGRAERIPVAIASRLGWPLNRLESLKDELTSLLAVIDGIE